VRDANRPWKKEARISLEAPGAPEDPLGESGWDESAGEVDELDGSVGERDGASGERPWESVCGGNRKNPKVST